MSKLQITNAIIMDKLTISNSSQESRKTYLDSANLNKRTKTGCQIMHKQINLLS